MRKLTLLFFAICPAVILCQNAGDYRTVNSGPWTTNTNWERYDGATWVPAATSPTNTDGVITVQNGHAMDIAGPLTIDQVMIESGATVNWNSGVLTINDDASGVDLDVQGTMVDNSTTSVSFSAGATWQLGSSGTIIRTQGNSSNSWQTAYQGGISSIPSTSNWILRKITAVTPSITSSPAFYGNLILENTSGGAWSTAGNSNFQGSSGFPTIKGSFDIGGTGSTTAISFSTTNTNAAPVLIQGDLIVRAMHTLTNSSGGRGFEVQGDVQVDGTLDDDGGGTGFGLLRFTGGNTQFVSGGGTILILEMVVNKSGGNVELQRNLSPNNLTLTSGNVVLNANTLTIPSGGIITGGSATSYVNTNSTGTLNRTVSASNTAFPVGKSGYNPLTLVNSGTSDQFSVRVFDEVWSDGYEGSGILLTSDAVGRTWIVDEAAAGGSNVTMTAQWNLSDELSAFTRSSCYISRYTGTGWQGSTVGSASGSGPYTRSRSGLTSFSPFAIASSSALPVELAYFEAHLKNNQVQLDWTTATETNNSHFAVERSADGRDFTPIGRVDGSGTLREPHDYHFTDHQPLSGPNYYRLRQVDFDGRFAFSPVRYVVLGSPLRIFPSPAAEHLRLEWNEQPEDAELSWEIFDGSGRQVLTGAVEEPGVRLEIPVETLLPGAYWIRLASAREGWTQFFLKQ